MRVENLQADTIITENGERVYSPNNKPTAADVGALTQATADGRYAGKTNVYTKGESDSRYLGKTAKATDSDKLDGIDSNGFVRKTDTTLDVGGDADKFYAIEVVLSSEKKQDVLIHRAYSERIAAVSPHWNGGSKTHFGGLSLLATFNGSAWGGMNPSLYYSIAQQYTDIVARIAMKDGGANSHVLSFWVRGGARYHIVTPLSAAAATVNLGSVLSETDTFFTGLRANKSNFAVSYLYERGQRVYSPNNKPTYTDVGAMQAGSAYTKSETDNRYLGKTSKASSATIADKANTVTDTNLGKTATTYLQVPNNNWWGDKGVGHSQMVKTESSGLPTKAPGYVFKVGARDVGKGHAWLYMDNYETGGNLWFGANQAGTSAPNWAKVYSTRNKPSWGDIQGTPNISWSNINSAPATATRWPTWNEVSGKPSTMNPSAHTHPWNQITGVPVYAQRWPSWSEVTSKPTDILSQSTADGRYLGKTAKAADAQLLDGINSDGFARVKSSALSFGGASGNWTTAQFVDWCRTQGALAVPYWVARGSWSYASNKTITDTGCGNIHLSGCVVEFIGTASAYTIRIVTPTTSSNGGMASAEFIYINNGNAYAPAWRRQYNTRNKPTAADVGALTQSTADGRYLGKTAKAVDSDKLAGISSSEFMRKYHKNSGSAKDFRSPGSYRVDPGVTDRPFSPYSQMLVVHGGGDTAMQIAGNYDSSHLYWRGFNFGSTGGQWNKIYTDRDKPTPAEIGALGASSKAVDSARLGGLSPSSGATANTIAQRDGAGDVHARLLRSNYQNESRCTGALAFRVNNTTDNYTRYCSSPTAVRDWVSDFVERVGFISSTGTPAWHKLFEFNASQTGALVSFDIVGSSGYNQGANQLFRIFGSVHTSNGSPANGIDGSYAFNGTVDLQINSWQMEMRVVPTNNTHFVVYARLPAYVGSGSYVLVRTHKASGVSGLVAHSNSMSSPNGGVTMKKQSPYTISTAAPSGGVDGDVWLQYE